VRKPIKLVLKILFENVHMIFYREARDFCKGFYSNPRWFLMRKIGRFESVKALVGLCRRHVRGRSPSLLAPDHQQTLFKELDIDRSLDELERDGLCLGVNLPLDVVHEIVQFAHQTRCYGNGKLDWGFFHHDKQEAAKRFSLKFSTADYFNTSESEVIRRVLNDPALLAIARRYLGGPPVHQGTRLRWSYGTELSELEKYKYSRMFHYDLDDYKAIKFFFYLTDVDMHTGPHVCVRGSHKTKRFSHRVLRGRCSDEEVSQYYGTDKVAVICGPAGTGFAEDAFCMHKGLTTIQEDRLVLILEYALRDYGMQHDEIDKSQLRGLIAPSTRR
jgi:hypothetical protein